MAVKQALISQGKAVVEEVPAPCVDPNGVLVRLSHSCISTGTELSGVKNSGIPLWKKALTQPEKIKKALYMLMTEGYAKTKNKIEGKLTVGTASGYSAAGTVIEVGEEITDIAVGDRVACAGAQFAHHAEIIQVPRNLVVPIPENLDFSQASSVALGGIALQGIRRAQPTLGETFVVIGLGFLGQLTAQMLKQNGCRVVGIDLDPSRLELAQKMGIDQAYGNENALENIGRFTDGIGADGVIITAATASHEVVSMAFQLCRRKGRVVLVGDVGLNLNRADFYQKEIDFFISTSYGPGRYDPSYEEKGIDYPLSYVRWTENRNMTEYLRLLAEKKIDILPLIHSIFPIENADAAYQALKEGTPKPLLALLSYPHDKKPISRQVTNRLAPQPSKNQIGIAVVGAGGFAKGMHLPNIQALSNLFHLRAIMSRTGHNAHGAAKQFGAAYATTDFNAVLNDPETDAVLIATPHHLHAKMALDALKAGKHVLLEKPLALNLEELSSIQEFYKTAEGPLLLTGFNRRFSKYAQALHAQVKGRAHPMILNYRMNAGYIPMNHWVHGKEGGGRNIGEACHIYDLFTFLTGAEVSKIDAQSIQTKGYYSPLDNFVATLSFKDGSVATLTYTAMGSKEYPKEQLEVFVEGKVFVLNDYCSLSGSNLSSKTPEKGQKEELEMFAKAIRHGGEWPIPLWQQCQAMEIAFAVEEQLRKI
jgi:predicted dehydrogenase